MESSWDRQLNCGCKVQFLWLKTCWQRGSCYFPRFLNAVWFSVASLEERTWTCVVHKRDNSYLAVLRSGCWVPTSFLTCMATLLSSSLRRHRRLMKEVGYPTIFSASDTTLLQFEGPELENRLRVLRPRLDRVRGRALHDSRDHIFSVVFLLLVDIWGCCHSRTCYHDKLCHRIHSLMFRHVIKQCPARALYKNVFTTQINVNIMSFSE